VQIESFSSLPLQAVIPSYLYLEYSDDEDLQSFVSSFNQIAQGYVDWFNQTPLSVYTSPNISGAFLDWVANGIWGIARPVLSNEIAQRFAGYDEAPYDTLAYNTLVYVKSGTAQLADDDTYKRVLTWNLYRGDGQMFCLQWLKNRIARFLNGPNGTDYPVLNAQPNITVSGSVFTVTASASTAYTNLQLAYANGALAFPFQYSMTFET
jgi:hypothetical protein